MVKIPFHRRFNFEYNADKVAVLFALKIIKCCGRQISE